MEKNRVVVLALIVVNIVLISWIVYSEKTKRKFGYILIQEVFNDFEMKKEMELKFKKTERARQRILDSLGFEYKVFLKNMKSEKKPNPEDINRLNLKEEEFVKTK